MISIKINISKSDTEISVLKNIKNNDEYTDKKCTLILFLLYLICSEMIKIKTYRKTYKYITDSYLDHIPRMGKMVAIIENLFKKITNINKLNCSTEGFIFRIYKLK